MHIAERLVFRTLLIVAMSFLTSCRITHHSPFEDDLEKIDAALNMADEYVHAKEQKIRTIENMLNSRGVNDLQKYHIYGQLFEEYEAYQFDKAKEMLENQEEIAECLGNLSLKNDALLDKAMLFINAGLYLETHQVFGLLDTTSFNAEQMVAWYNARQKFLSDYDEYVSSSGVKVPDIEKVAYYQNQILKNTPESDAVNQHIRVLRLISQKDYDKASKQNSSILAGMDSGSRDYAIRAYWQGFVAGLKGKIAPSVMPYLNNPEKVTGTWRPGILTLWVDSDFTKSMLGKPVITDSLTIAAEGRFGAPTRIELKVGKPPKQEVSQPVPQTPVSTAAGAAVEHSGDPLDALVAFGEQFDNIVIQ